jgi:hypothetical protein
LDLQAFLHYFFLMTYVLWRKSHPSGDDIINDVAVGDVVFSADVCRKDNVRSPWHLPNSVLHSLDFLGISGSQNPFEKKQ